MNTYSLKDLNTIFNAKTYLPLDRFVHYFTLRFGYTEKDAISAYKLFAEFPKQIYGTDEAQEKIDKIIPLAINLVDELHKNWESNSRFKNLSYDDKELRKLIYSENDEVKEVVLNLHDTNDIITFSEMLKRGIKSISLLRYCCKTQLKNSDKQLQVFEGDLFDTNDMFWGVKSNIYVAEKDSTFRKLIYIKGKGYIDKNGELNMEDNSYTSYVLSLAEWRKIGNTTTDLIKLTDDGKI